MRRDHGAVAATCGFLATTVFLGAFSAPGTLAAQETILAVRREGKSIVADLAFRWPSADGLLESLRKGTGSRITFDFRLSRERAAFLPFLREAAVGGKVLSRTATFDVYSRQYVVEEEGGGKTRFGQADDFLDGFFRARGVVLAQDAQPGRFTVTAQVRYEPIRLIPPLNIIFLFDRSSTRASAWTKVEVGP
jgi:hypothetical protein